MVSIEDEGFAARFLTTTELVAAARQRLDDQTWDYVCGGAETEATLARNRSSLDAIAFRPRVLRRVDKVEAGGEFLGVRCRLPVLLAPLGTMTEFDPRGALPSATAARRFGCPVMVSCIAGSTIEDCAAAAGERFIYQLYMIGDDDWVDDQVAMAVSLGARALCVTVDVAHYGRRERSILRRHAVGRRPVTGTAPGDEFLQRCDWQTIARLRDSVTVPLIIKGIATAEDAQLAVEHGVDVIYVSNHGGRQLDHGRGAIDMLPEVVAAVRGKSAIAIDGGFLRGTDVLKAMALGADIVGLGRLQALALAAAGQTGVERMLALLEEEMVAAMRLLGVSTCDELDGSYLHPVPSLARGGLAGAFPFAPIGNDR